MKTVRSALALVICLLLALGYAASQWAFFHGQAADYAKRVDTPPVRLLALALLIGCVVLTFVPARPRDDSGEAE